MSLRKSTTSKLEWLSPLEKLSKAARPSKTILSLKEAGIKNLYDLVLITPNQVEFIPDFSPFSEICIDENFRSKGELLNIKMSPAFGRKGKGRIQLFNITAIVKESSSNALLTLKWFNAYPNIKNALSDEKSIEFFGKIQELKGVKQIVNPMINPKFESRFLIKYPTKNAVNSKNIEKLIKAIPSYLWQEELYPIGEVFKKIKGFSFIELLQNMHFPNEMIDINEVQKHIFYSKNLNDFLKVYARKKRNTTITTQPINISAHHKIFEYELTHDQIRAIEDIKEDLQKNYSMMRLIQGDVGSGKTSVAIFTAFAVAQKGFQVAVMAPTETLACQLHENFKKALPTQTVEILIGSTPKKDRNILLTKLAKNETQIIIGTHALFQKDVIFNKLGLVIIDEQHKFGVKQRQELVNKGANAHVLLMTATPIPRTLQLVQYGDLDISSIMTMPNKNKTIKTKIINSSNYEKYLSFVNTRLSIEEQVYIVVPAVTESEVLNIENIENKLIEYRNFFKGKTVEALHGQLKSGEKEAIFTKFKEKKIDILIATSIVEVGVDVHNATTIAIYNPDRFGLSSLHQLRGRVGRGKKAGFCFLITNKNMSLESKERVKILDESTDGFYIAQKDLEIRGHGDLFGAEQSGFSLQNGLKEMLNLINQVNDDIKSYKNSDPEGFDMIIKEYLNSEEIYSII